MEKDILMNSKKQKKKEITCVLNWRFKKDIKIHKSFGFFSDGNLSIDFNNKEKSDFMTDCLIWSDKLRQLEHWLKKDWFIESQASISLLLEMDKKRESMEMNHSYFHLIVSLYHKSLSKRKIKQ